MHPCNRRLPDQDATQRAVSPHLISSQPATHANQTTLGLFEQRKDYEKGITHNRTCPNTLTIRAFADLTRILWTLLPHHPEILVYIRLPTNHTP
jgi:hypothetical protein